MRICCEIRGKRNWAAGRSGNASDGATVEWRVVKCMGKACTNVVSEKLLPFSCLRLWMKRKFGMCHKSSFHSSNIYISRVYSNIYSFSGSYIGINNDEILNLVFIIS